MLRSVLFESLRGISICFFLRLTHRKSPENIIKLNLRFQGSQCYFGDGKLEEHTNCLPTCSGQNIPGTSKSSKRQTVKSWWFGRNLKATILKIKPDLGEVFLNRFPSLMGRKFNFIFIWRWSIKTWKSPTLFPDLSITAGWQGWGWEEETGGFCQGKPWQVFWSQALGLGSVRTPSGCWENMFYRPFLEYLLHDLPPFTSNPFRRAGTLGIKGDPWMIVELFSGAMLWVPPRMSLSFVTPSCLVWLWGYENLKTCISLTFYTWGRTGLSTL